MNSFHCLEAKYHLCHKKKDFNKCNYNKNSSLIERPVRCKALYKPKRTGSFSKPYFEISLTVWNVGNKPMLI